MRTKYWLTTLKVSACPIILGAGEEVEGAL